MNLLKKIRRRYVVKQIKNFLVAKMKVSFVNLGLQYDSLREEIISLFDKLSSAGSYILNNELNV